jgi:L-ribulose-5-phosphate 4-epimerase
LLEELKREVCWANQQLPKLHLVAWTSGNVCGRDPKTGLVVVKPSGVLFDDLRPEIMPVVDLDGKRVEGDLKVSVDTPTALYILKHMS